NLDSASVVGLYVLDVPIGSVRGVIVDSRRQWGLKPLWSPDGTKLVVVDVFDGTRNRILEIDLVRLTARALLMSERGIGLLHRRSDPARGMDGFTFSARTTLGDGMHYMNWD